MQDQPIFKKATIGGFDKKSVLEYIYELNNAAQHQQEQQAAQLEDAMHAQEQLGEAIKGLETRLQSKQIDFDHLAEELRQEKRRVSELDTLMESLKFEQRKQQNIVQQKDEEVTRYLQENNQLRQRNQTLEDKRQEVENASIHIGELLLRTRTDSEQLIADAATKAEQAQAKANTQAGEALAEAGLKAEELIAQAQRKAEDMTVQAEAKAETLVADATRSLAEIQSKFQLFRGDITGIQAQILSSLTAMEDKFASITGAVANAEATLSEMPSPQLFYEAAPDSPQNQEPGSQEEGWEESDNVTFFRPAAES